MIILRDRRWDPKRDDVESLWSRLNEAWRDLRTALVVTADLRDECVTAAKLAADAVTSTKIADDAVTAAKIAAGAVGTVELATDAVTTTKIANGSVTPLKLAQMPAASITRAAAQSVANGTGGLTIDFTSDVFTATGGSFAPSVNLAANTITVQLAGIYRVSARLGFQCAASAVAGSIMVCDIRIGGGTVATASAPCVLNAATTVDVSVLLSLAASSVLDVGVFQNSGAAQNTLTGTSAPRLSVEYVGGA